MNNKPKPTEQELNEGFLASWVYQRYNESKANKAPRVTLDKACIDAYNGDIKTIKPNHASNHISNYIFATLETIRPIMTDNNPKFQALARSPEGKEKAEAVQMALSYEWDRTHMSTTLPKALLTALKTGTAIFYLPWDKTDVKCIEINPFNFFPDPMATSIADAEYVIYATYKNINTIKKLFPNSASKLSGAGISEEDLVPNVPIVPVNNQILVLECWTRDYTYRKLDGGEEVRNFPKGRVITVAPIQSVLLSDRPNPYNDGKFPFVLLKDYDVPFQLWGNGDVEQLLAPQYSMSELDNAVIDNAKHTANMAWVVDKNAGIPHNSLTNEPGLVIRKNPGTEVRRDNPPPMPMYVGQKIDELKTDIEYIAGVHDSTRGKAGGSVVAAQAIMALQEAGQARIRLKVKIMEEALSELATMWYSRMQQFWKEDRIIRIADINGKVIDDNLTTKDLTADFDIMITTGSTMPLNRNAMLDLMIRLGQTQAEDGLPVVDREAIMEFVPVANKSKILERFEALKENQLGEEAAAMEQQLEQMLQMVEELTKEVEDIKTKQTQEDKKKADNELVKKGYENGQSSKGLTDDEMSDIIEGSKKIPDEVLQEIEKLSDEDMQKLLQVYPDLAEIIGNNT